MMAKLSSIAIQTHRMEAMVAFYTEAFGGEFREVDTGGPKAWFGDVNEITLKLVELLDDVDFDGYPLHQLGFSVDDAEAVIAIAVKHGGCQEGDVARNERQAHGSVRDPDGNTIELYSKL